jgi:hypothetical protein
MLPLLLQLLYLLVFPFHDILLHLNWVKRTIISSASRPEPIVRVNWNHFRVGRHLRNEMFRVKLMQLFTANAAGQHRMWFT